MTRVVAWAPLVLTLAAGACQGLTAGGDGDRSRGPDGGAGAIDKTDADPPVPLLPLSSVVITEIMYHPAYEQADQDNHEFIEIYNRDTKPVALGQWKLTGKKGMTFTFPGDAVLMRGEYAVVAKDKRMLTVVYGLSGVKLFGDYQGELNNGKDTVVLADAAGKAIDLVAYGGAFPWPIAADALGVAEDWLPKEQRPITNHQYKGCSLERISVDGPPGSSTMAANWEASPIDGATPGERNKSAGALLPIAEDTTAGPDGAPAGLIRNTDKLTIRARFSSFGTVSNVQVEYFRDDIAAKTKPATKTAAMTLDADGYYKAVLSDETLTDNDLIRYRIRANRDGGPGTVAPRASDPLASFTAFVSPTVFVKSGVETQERVYHLFIRPADWSQLEKWLSFGISSPDGNAGCAFFNPDWNSVVPATLVADGHAYDVRVRYEGSNWNRDEGMLISKWSPPRPNPSGAANKPDLVMNAPLRVLSWRINFPRYDRPDGLSGITLNKLLQGFPGTVSVVEDQLLEKVRVPSYHYQFARLHINGGYYGYMGQPEDFDAPSIGRIFPDEPFGELYKNKGGSNTGPISRGDFWPLDNLKWDLCPKTPQGVLYKPLDYYAATYERKNYDYRSYDEIKGLIEDLQKARKAGVDAVRKYFNDKWDVPTTMATFVVRKWSGAWDDRVHNMFPYKRPNGKWIPLQQDYEQDFGLGWGGGDHGNTAQEPASTLYYGWSDPQTQFCELPDVKTTADATARGCTECHAATKRPVVGDPAWIAMFGSHIATDGSLKLPVTGVMQAWLTSPYNPSCQWGGMPAMPTADEACNNRCLNCHTTNVQTVNCTKTNDPPPDPKMALTFPTPSYTGEQIIKNGCRWSRTSSLLDAFIGAFKDEIDKTYCRLTMDGTLSAEGVLKVIDDAVKTISLDDWMASPAVKEYCAGPDRSYGFFCRGAQAHEQLRSWARARYQTVMQRLGCK